MEPKFDVLRNHATSFGISVPEIEVNGRNYCHLVLIMVFLILIFPLLLIDCCAWIVIFYVLTYYYDHHGSTIFLIIICYNVTNYCYDCGLMIVAYNTYNVSTMIYLVVAFHNICKMIVDWLLPVLWIPLLLLW